ncbi:para-aminobenzoate synthase [Aliidongia dinghuensis]|uniref:aminodeoxychorismate synthase n=1 Tax=Aliidongia dinghuensis TaxID=1867774 RepID=A0A8J2YUQ9_9PROT|nr:aminodeoxychorismate synthase component I [Aliidongia dinghuensis]GGF24752.1 para-aminobenzoate synthase [Aliidongia dinghuensis]
MIVQEIPYTDPLAVFAHWADEPYVSFLDSAAAADPRSRYSYLAVEPFRIVEAQGGAVRTDGAPDDADPFAVLERELARFRIEPGATPVPFPGGAVGFLGYELGRHLERLPPPPAAGLDMPDMVMGFYDLVIAFDQRDRRAWILSSGFPETDPARQDRRAMNRVVSALRRLERPAPALEPARRSGVVWQAELTRADYEARVARVLDYIYAGDIYQANFTMRHLLPRPLAARPAEIYCALRARTAAPFAAYLGCGADLALAGASPERFLRVSPDGRVETRPIKGTRPRGKTAEEDAALAHELAASAKDRAENLMITDLLRNDLGRVAALASVHVPSLCAVESFSTVHHLVSAVEARLRPNVGLVDLLRATFPGGSITGAPKIRAMEIIAELEMARRGAYCGAIAWLGYDGAMDSSVTIRTLSVTRELVVAQAGGGIVADSVPSAEYDEMMVKVGPLLDAVGTRAP